TAPTAQAAANTPAGILVRSWRKSWVVAVTPHSSAASGLPSNGPRSSTVVPVPPPRASPSRTACMYRVFAILLKATTATRKRVTKPKRKTAGTYGDIWVQYRMVGGGTSATQLAGTAARDTQCSAASADSVGAMWHLLGAPAQGSTWNVPASVLWTQCR